MADKNPIKGTANADTLNGTLQDDIIQGYSGDDVIDGSDGNDDIYASSGNDVVHGGAGNDYIDAGSGNDVVFDGAGNDVVVAGSGNDRVVAGIGDDQYVGGSGFDTIDFSLAGNGVVVDLSKGTATGVGVDNVQGFERVVGSAHADKIKGSEGADVIQAGEGNNTIRGMGGADDLTGGTGKDKFVFKTADVVDGAGNHLGVDTIHGFESNDSIDLRSMLEGLTYFDSLDEIVQLTDTAAGTMVQVDMGKGFVDVALLEGVYTGGASAQAWAGDGLILA